MVGRNEPGHFPLSENRNSRAGEEFGEIFHQHCRDKVRVTRKIYASCRPKLHLRIDGVQIVAREKLRFDANLVAQVNLVLRRPLCLGRSEDREEALPGELKIKTIAAAQILVQIEALFQ